MKLIVELKDAPKYRRVETVVINTDTHANVTVAAVVKAAKVNRPWVKIIDIRLDLR